MLPPVVNRDLEGNRQSRVHILKGIGEIHLVWLFFQYVLDLEIVGKTPSNAHHVRLTIFWLYLLT